MANKIGVIQDRAGVRTAASEAAVLLLSNDVSQAAPLVVALSKGLPDLCSCPILRVNPSLIDDIGPDLILFHGPTDVEPLIGACERLRDMTDRPIAVLAEVADSLTVTRAFEAGVDEFFALPMNDAELTARVTAFARRWRQSAPANNLSFGDLRLHPDEQRVDCDGRSVNMTPMEFRLLACLVAAQGHVVTHDYLMANVWGTEYVDSRHYLHLYIRYLRDKLEADPKKPELIISEWGIGYRLQRG